ncbi:dynein light chain 1, axonemal protein (macronuclear) [Tetrahymena thermophila SB210]|uniref:Dynein axonemal light chain 1 n=2 Tax=Tetrahymena thermophila TaxID=5911 RepID=I7M1N7_TETTS|nr:dynein light chain 1, axonemal protein [Tetrahymena thermophila SB210]ABF22551.1 dynein light chain 1 [Tetrahymena thermophila]EAR97252.1 dynein light chain 1, axonemal protein [Tetrahymena thermophila SB210]7KEK_Q Chain Q, Dynein light chain 1 [Tetrahymena thermophila]8BX8_Q Chain Q, Dynein light chain 1 [Tetrahymena thermophila]|eukprot:XP_001017497.1 dynein light chain 1, axonemal protein [Tetrahymena thermophila SB210]
MSKGTTCQKAIVNWEAANPGKNPSEAEEIKLIFQIPPIEKMDGPVLNTLTKCKKLSLSSNSIDKMISLNMLRNLEILSLSRNVIKKISGLEDIGGTLRQLWLSYNFIEKLDGLNNCSVLQTLYIGNNRIKNWEELDKLKDLPELENVLFYGNPIYEQVKEDPKLIVLKKLPTLKNVDGYIIDDSVLEKVKQIADIPISAKQL